MAPGELPDTFVPHLFRWCRQQLKQAEGQGHRPADPAEFLVELLDTNDAQVDTACFESERVKRYECQTCGHVRRETTQETMLILPMLHDGASPVRRAVDLEFGYLRPANDPEVERVSGHTKSSGSAEQERDALRRNHDETWWRCDDGSVQEVVLTSATPYVLFYEELEDLDTVKPTRTANAPKTPQGPPTPAVPVQFPIMALDCDEGKCQGARRDHTVYVESYELGTNLVIHLACPRLMDMSHVERTLITRSDTTSKSYVLRSFIARVGGCHYVAYTRK